MNTQYTPDQSTLEIMKRNEVQWSQTDQVTQQPKLRPYQEGAVNGVRQSLRAGHRRVLVQASTGAGKTVTAASIIISSVAKGNRVLFLADTLELVEQAVATFDKWGLDVGVMQGDHYRTDESCMVQVCTPQTISARLKKQRANFEQYPVGLILVDECHVVYKARDSLAEIYPNAPFIGLTATPFTKGLGRFYTDVVEMIPMSTLIDQGYLSDYTAYGPDVPDMTGVAMSGEDYNAGGAAEVMSNQNLVGSILDHWKKYAEGMKTIVFACNVAHSKALSRMFVDAGYSCEHVDGYPTSADAAERKAERFEIIERFRKGETQILCNVAIATKGFDVPDIGCIVLAKPTKSEMLLWQMVGRGLRTAEGKDGCVVLDHGGSLLRLGFPEDRTDFSLCDGTKKTSDKKKERQERLPTPCPACSFLRPAGVHKCPKCNFAPERQHEVVNIDGELVPLKTAQAMEKPWNAGSKATKEVKQQVYSELVRICEDHGKKKGWVGHTYREMFEIWPKGLDWTASNHVSRDVEKFVTNKNAKFRRQMKKDEAA